MLRCGWLDIPVLKFTSTVNGYTAIALTKLDILDQLEEIKIGVKYMKNGSEIKHFPSSEQVRVINYKDERNCCSCELKSKALIFPSFVIQNSDLPFLPSFLKPDQLLI